MKATNMQQDTNFSHYKKDVSHLDYIDVYRILDLFEVKNHAVGHAIKKLLVPGGRGVKDIRQDLVEASKSIERALQMLDEDENKGSRDTANVKSEDKRGWIAWNGGGIPVPFETKAEVKLRNGACFTGRAGRYSWEHDGNSGDIVAYRVVSAAK